MKISKIFDGNVKILYIQGTVLCSGLIAGMVQLAVIRELFVCFFGTEISSVLLMAGWLLLSGIGGMISGKVLQKVQLGDLFLIQLLSGGALFVIWGSMKWGNFLYAFSTGQVPGWIEVLSISLIVIMPFCVSSAIVFGMCLRLLAHYKGIIQDKSANHCYILDCAGMLLGYVFSYFFLIPLLGMEQIILVCMALYLILAILNVHVTSLSNKDKIRIGRVFGKLAVSILLLSATIFCMTRNVGLFNSKDGMQEFIGTQEGEYSRITVTRAGGQLNFYMNGQSEGNYPFENPVLQKKIFTTLGLCGCTRNVLVIGGILQGTVDMVESELQSTADKSAPVSVFYADIDKGPLEIYQRYCLSADKGNAHFNNIQYIQQDPRSLIKKEKNKWDIIIVTVPMPSNLLYNRFYTQEFFKQCSIALCDKGVLLVNLESTGLVSGEFERKRNTSILKAIQEIFKGTAFFSGEEQMILASDNPNTLGSLSNTSAGNLLEEAVLPFNQFYGKKNFVSDEVLSNSDLIPVSIFYQNALRSEMMYQFTSIVFHSLAKVRGLHVFILVFIMGMLLVGCIFIKPLRIKVYPAEMSSAIVFIQGIVSFSGVTLLIYLYQITYGNLYSELGLLLSSVMLGYMLGSILCNFIKVIRKKQGVIVIISAIAFLLLLLLLTTIFRNTPGRWTLLMLACTWGMISGSFYPIFNAIFAAKKIKQSVILYSMELCGSAVGALLTSVLLLPLMGVIQALLLLLSLEIICPMLIYMNYKRGRAC